MDLRPNLNAIPAFVSGDDEMDNVGTEPDDANLRQGNEGPHDFCVSEPEKVEAHCETVLC